MKFNAFEKIFNKENSKEVTKNESLPTFPKDPNAPKTNSEIEEEEKREHAQKEVIIGVLRKEFSENLPKDSLGIIDTPLLREMSLSELQELQQTISDEIKNTIISPLVEKEYENLLQKTPTYNRFLRFIKIKNKEGIRLREQPDEIKQQLAVKLETEAKKSQLLHIKSKIDEIKQKRIYKEKEAFPVFEKEEDEKQLFLKSFEVQTMKQHFFDTLFGFKSGMGQTIEYSSNNNIILADLKNKDIKIVLDVLAKSNNPKDVNVLEQISNLSVEVLKKNGTIPLSLVGETFDDWVTRMFTELKK